MACDQCPRHVDAFRAAELVADQLTSGYVITEKRQKEGRFLFRVMKYKGGQTGDHVGHVAVVDGRCNPNSAAMHRIIDRSAKGRAAIMLTCPKCKSQLSDVARLISLRRAYASLIEVEEKFRDIDRTELDSKTRTAIADAWESVEEIARGVNGRIAVYEAKPSENPDEAEEEVNDGGAE